MSRHHGSLFNLGSCASQSTQTSTRSGISSMYPANRHTVHAYHVPNMHTCMTDRHMYIQTDTHYVCTDRYAYQCCGHYRGITINYHCNYLSIKALRLPLPLRISTKVINYHCNYISTIAITITNYRFILGCLQKLLHSTEISCD